MVSDHERVKRSNFIKAVVFAGLGAILFLAFSWVLVPKWDYPQNPDNAALSIEEPRRMKADTVEAVFLGTSHIKSAVSPMHIYEEYGVVTYNMATSRQTPEISLYQAQEIFRRQSPKVLVLDASALFLGDDVYRDAYYRQVIDSVPFSLSPEKLRLIRSYIADKYEYIGEGPDGKDLLRDWISCIFPIFNYHARWNELTESDFAFPLDNYYLKGFRMIPLVDPAKIDAGGMNEDAVHMREYDKKITVAYENGAEKTTEEEKILYSASIPDKYAQILREIRDLCRQNNCGLLVTKIPVIAYPRDYSSAWPRDRYEEVKRVTSELGIDYLDLLYDMDAGIDWSADTLDGGMHLNYKGAVKVSSFLGDYLTDHYGLKLRKDEDYERRSAIYDEAVRVAELEMETGLPAYLNALSKEKERYAVMLSAMNDMRASLSEEDISALEALGLRTDFAGMERGDSYIALVERGEVVYEAASNRKIRREFTLSSGVGVNLESAGYYCGNLCRIYLNDVKYSVGSRGINIVVYDCEAGQVVDSVCFDTHSSKPRTVRMEPKSFYEKYTWFLMNR